MNKMIMITNSLIFVDHHHLCNSYHIYIFPKQLPDNIMLIHNTKKDMDVHTNFFNTSIYLLTRAYKVLLNSSICLCLPNNFYFGHHYLLEDLGLSNQSNSSYLVQIPSIFLGIWIP